MFRFAPSAHEGESHVPSVRQGTADITAAIVNDARHEFAEMAPSLLKQKVVALVFLPWLTRYTGRLVEAAKAEERRAILDELARDKSSGKGQWHAGYKAAVNKLHALILARSE